MHENLADIAIPLKKQFQSFLNIKFKKYNLKSSEILFLNLLKNKGSKTQIEISRLIECDKSHVHRIANKLITKNLIIYDTNNQHGKNQRLSLTKAGKDITDRFKEIFDNWQNSLLEDISEDEIIITKKVIEKLIKNANNLNKKLENYND